MEPDKRYRRNYSSPVEAKTSKKLVAPHFGQFRLGFLVALLSIMLISCDDFLDEVPDNRVALNDLEKAAQLVTNAYSVASPAFTEWMSDNVGYTKGVTIRPSQQQAYEWDEITGGPTEPDTPEFFWYQTYDAIAHANEVLAVINELPAETAEDEARRDAIKGEALLARAYGHFMLVNLFGQHYTIDDSELGIPYIKDPETVFIQTYERAKVRKVYREIEDDLRDGLELISDNFYNNSGKYHFNRNAALAFASRFYLFKGEYPLSLQYSNELLGSNPATFVRDMTSTEFRNAKSSIQGFPQLYSSPDLPANLLLMRKISLIQRPDFGHGPTRNFYGQLFGSSPFPGATDERENPAFVKGENALLPVRYQNLFERSSLNSNVGTPYHIALAFRGEEVLLNRAEVLAIQNDLDGALEDLQVLAERRYTGDDIILTREKMRAFFGATNEPSFTDQLVILNYIIVERRKEFIMQGMRWFDLKRFEFPVVHELVDGSTIRLESDDLRKVLQIPTSAIDVGGLEPNPR